MPPSALLDELLIETHPRREDHVSNGALVLVEASGIEDGQASFGSGYSSRAALVDGKVQFTAITLKPVITLPTGGDAAKAKELIEKAEANCLISNSMKVHVSLELTIR